MAKDPIKKAENGTYYFRANLGYHPVTGKQIQKYRSGFSTKKEARAEYSKLILASTEELADKKEDITFKKFIEEIYLPWYKTQVKESTYKNRYSTIQKHFAYFYKKKVSEIEAINVQTWQLKLAKQFSPNYVRIVQGMLCLAFDRAIILGLAKKNPARMIGNIKSKKVKIDFWTLEEFQKVISLLYKGDYYEHVDQHIIIWHFRRIKLCRNNAGIFHPRTPGILVITVIEKIITVITRLKMGYFNFPDSANYGIK